MIVVLSCFAFVLPSTFHNLTGFIFLNRTYGRWSLFTLVFLIDMEIALLRPCGDSALAGRTVHQLPKETTINPLHSIVLCFEDRAHSFVDFFMARRQGKFVLDGAVPICQKRMPKL